MMMFRAVLIAALSMLVTQIQTSKAQTYTNKMPRR